MRRQKLLHVGGDSRYELPDPASKPIFLVPIKNTYSLDGEFEAELSRRIGGRYPRDAPQPSIAKVRPRSIKLH
jgi:hypothetical protein